MPELVAAKRKVGGVERVLDATEHFASRRSHDIGRIALDRSPNVYGDEEPSVATVF